MVADTEVESGAEEAEIEISATEREISLPPARTMVPLVAEEGQDGNKATEPRNERHAVVDEQSVVRAYDNNETGLQFVNYPLWRKRAWRKLEKKEVGLMRAHRDVIHEQNLR